MTKTKMTRLVVCIDFDTDDPKEAYRRLLAVMEGCEDGWETSDEWYSSAHDDGESPAPAEVLQRAIAETLEGE